jgi:hypothetical protein
MDSALQLAQHSCITPLFCVWGRHHHALPPVLPFRADQQHLSTTARFPDSSCALHTKDKPCCCHRFLIEAAFDKLAEAVYKAPFVCLAHNKFEEGVEDPMYTYANKAALELFEGDWDSIIGLPSRKSAEPDSQEVGIALGPVT